MLHLITMKRHLLTFGPVTRWWQRLSLRLRRWWRSEQSAPERIAADATPPAATLDLGVVTGTPMGCMMSDLQRKSAALREAAEQARALAQQVRADARAGTQRLREQRALEPPAQDALRDLTEQLRELRERVHQSEERIEQLMSDAADQAVLPAQPPETLVSEGQLTSHPILRHARAANQ